MRKMTLHPDELRVESFHTTPADGAVSCIGVK